MNVELERKLKRERIAVCLHCKKLVGCSNVGAYEECVDFDEIDCIE